jgi:peptidoglycan pentaglycine glycine transferase (the first glycine)
MYSCRLIGESEREAFNAFVSRAPKGHILQSFEWGKVKKDWQPFHLLIEADGQPAAAISILKRTIPVIGKAIFYAPRGPVGDIHDEALMDYLFSQVQYLARQQKAIFLKIDPDVPVSDTQFLQYLQSRKFSYAGKGKGEGFEGIQPKFVFRLDIRPDIDTLFQNLHQKTRYNIRLAQRKGVTIRQDCDEKDLPDFYRILKETTERDNFLVRSYSYFETLWQELAPKGYLKLFMAEYEGQPIAGTLAFLYGDKAWYIYGASSNEHRNVMPNYLIQWTMIEWAKANNCTMYDFRGVSGDLSEDNPLYGLYRFKKGFNGEFTEFIGEFDRVYSGFWYAFWNNFEPVYQKLVRKLIALRKKRRSA